MKRGTRGELRHVLICHRCGLFFIRAHPVHPLFTLCLRCREARKKRPNSLLRYRYTGREWKIPIPQYRPKMSSTDFQKSREKNNEVRMAKLLLVPDRRRTGKERREELKKLPMEMVEVAIAYRELRKARKRWQKQSSPVHG